MSSQAPRKSSLVVIAALTFIVAGLSAPSAWARQGDANTAASPPSSREEALDNAGVISLKQLGLGDSVLIEKIKTSRCNFDVGLQGLKQLKTGGLSDAVIAAVLAAENNSTSGPSDPNDPRSPHESGIWLYGEATGKPSMTQLEPSVYSQSRSGSMIFMGYGATAKQRAVLRGAHAQMVTTNRDPVFYFYFENTQSGLGGNNGATTPNEYILAQFEVKTKEDQRRLVIGSLNAYSGGSSGTEEKSVRSFSFEKLAPGIYKVSPKEPLANGEYGFFYGQTSRDSTGGKVFDFGVAGSPDTEPAPKPTQVKKKHGITSIFRRNVQTDTTRASKEANDQ